ncbi:hypothetical protein L1987_57040 [Smallanthus sonchifolius]|uniref:Uncharacterized protein n=1 Tax=Smallanthus sonchifolius TaxID=185202 RepID=A0ACB9DBX9_9ASTR|nr:hypothetical protein L1987_57040 [Smallanthus sonchifolius]
MMLSRALCSSEANTIEVGATEAVKELHDKLLKSLMEQRTAPPNSWLSNLRIFENFNDNLCREVSKACARVDSIDFGKKTLWKHNVYGLTPSVASAHCILIFDVMLSQSYAKQHNDVNLMVDVIKLLKANDVPLQPGTADIIFSICYGVGNWELMSKYAKRFGCLLERKPEEAAAIVQVVTQTLPEGKRPDIMAELEKLASEWPLEVIKSRKDEDKMALAAGLQ